MERRLKSISILNHYEDGKRRAGEINGGERRREQQEVRGGLRYKIKCKKERKRFKYELGL
jgi:hypothetical protein